MEWQILIFATHIQIGQPEIVRDVPKDCMHD